MEEALGSALLRDGATLVMSLLRTPAPEMAGVLGRFYVHKGERWQYHIDASLRRPMDALQTRFYLGRCGNEVITAVTTITCRGVGYVGHVFTEPAHRGRGASSHLFRAMVESERAQGARALYLTTDYGTTPYRIYQRCGFTSRYPNSGEMEWFATDEESFQEEYFRAGACSARPLRWEDWPLLNPLTARKDERVVSYGLHDGFFRPRHFEYDFLTLKQGLECFPGWEGRVLESEHGSVVGLATLIPRWDADDVRVLDVLVHPRFVGEMARFVASLPRGGRRTIAYAAETEAERIAALEGAGFRVVLRAPGRCHWTGAQPSARLLLQRDE
ncbi:MAG: GNAT family N-acetyltransferase [Armatimonadota bacterium]|nr:GNAT family N-acetyltransferase [Armatimonadota bacterium]